MAIPNHVQIQKLIKVLGTDFALSLNSNMRKGGLIGLAAMAIALGKVKTIFFCLERFNHQTISNDHILWEQFVLILFIADNYSEF